MNAYENHIKRIEIALRKMESLGDEHIKIYTGEIRRVVAQMIKTFGEEVNHIKKDVRGIEHSIKSLFETADSAELLLRTKLDRMLDFLPAGDGNFQYPQKETKTMEEN